MRSRKIMIAIHLSVETDDRTLCSDLFNGPGKLGPGSTAPVPGDGQLTLQSLLIRKAFGFPETIKLLLSCASATALNVIGNWLYDKLKGRKAELRIEEMEVDVDAGEIKRVLARVIEKRED